MLTLTVLIFEKDAKTRQTVFRVNSCFKVSFNLLLVIIKIKFISFFINLLIFLCNLYLN
jgi:hypothetical protein